MLVKYMDIELCEGCMFGMQTYFVSVFRFLWNVVIAMFTDYLFVVENVLLLQMPLTIKIDCHDKWMC